MKNALTSGSKASEVNDSRSAPYGTGGSARADGNNVDIDLEMGSASAKRSLLPDAHARSNDLAQFRSAIRGQ